MEEGRLLGGWGSVGGEIKLELGEASTNLCGTGGIAQPSCGQSPDMFLTGPAYAGTASRCEDSTRRESQKGHIVGLKLRFQSDTRTAIVETVVSSREDIDGDAKLRYNDDGLDIVYGVPLCNIRG